MVEPHLQIIMQSGGTVVGVSAAGSLDDSADVCLCARTFSFSDLGGPSLHRTDPTHFLLFLSSGYGDSERY